MLFQKMFTQADGSSATRYQGTLSYWYEDKGYGFITPVDGSQDVFIYYSQLDHIGRKPLLGDVISYELNHTCGRPKAIYAVLVSSSQMTSESVYKRPLLQSNTLFRIGTLIIIGIIIFMLFERWLFIA